MGFYNTDLKTTSIIETIIQARLGARLMYDSMYYKQYLYKNINTENLEASRYKIGDIINTLEPVYTEGRITPNVMLDEDLKKEAVKDTAVINHKVRIAEVKLIDNTKVDDFDSRIYLDEYEYVTEERLDQLVTKSFNNVALIERNYTQNKFATSAHFYIGQLDKTLCVKFPLSTSNASIDVLFFNKLIKQMMTMIGLSSVNRREYPVTLLESNLYLELVNNATGKFLPQLLQQGVSQYAKIRGLEYTPATDFPISMTLDDPLILDDLIAEAGCAVPNYSGDKKTLLSGIDGKKWELTNCGWGPSFNQPGAEQFYVEITVTGATGANFIFSGVNMDLLDPADLNKILGSLIAPTGFGGRIKAGMDTGAMPFQITVDIDQSQPLMPDSKGRFIQKYYANAGKFVVPITLRPNPKSYYPDALGNMILANISIKPNIAIVNPAPTVGAEDGLVFDNAVDAFSPYNSSAKAGKIKSLFLGGTRTSLQCLPACAVNGKYRGTFTFQPKQRTEHPKNAIVDSLLVDRAGGVTRGLRAGMRETQDINGSGFSIVGQIWTHKLQRDYSDYILHTSHINDFNFNVGGMLITSEDFAFNTRGALTLPNGDLSNNDVNRMLGFTGQSVKDRQKKIISTSQLNPESDLSSAV